MNVSIKMYDTRIDPIGIQSSVERNFEIILLYSTSWHSNYVEVI